MPRLGLRTTTRSRLEKVIRENPELSPATIGKRIEFSQETIRKVRLKVFGGEPPIHEDEDVSDEMNRACDAFTARVRGAIPRILGGEMRNSDLVMLRRLGLSWQRADRGMIL